MAEHISTCTAARILTAIRQSTAHKARNTEHDRIEDSCRDEDDWSALFSPPQQPGEIGRIAGYGVLRLLGSGSMGAVFEAEETQLARLVAPRRCMPQRVDPKSPAVLARGPLCRSRPPARTSIVMLFPQVGQDRGVRYRPELLEGENLEAAMRAKSMLVSEAVRIAREIAGGLAASHAKGLLHRDVEPSNIWLEGPQRRSKSSISASPAHRTTTPT